MFYNHSNPASRLTLSILGGSYLGGGLEKQYIVQLLTSRSVSVGRGPQFHMLLYVAISSYYTSMIIETVQARYLGLAVVMSVYNDGDSIPAD